MPAPLAGLAVAHRGRPFPRDFWIAGRPIYLGTLLSAVVGARAGISPLRVGAGCLVVAIVGMIGARLFYVAVNLRAHRRSSLRRVIWDSSNGGWSVFGGLAIVPVLAMVKSVFGIPVAVFWDLSAFAIAFGGAWIRFGCICNGCCVGRESSSWCALRQHDTQGVCKRRIPVQWLEIAWWLAGLAGLFAAWPGHLPHGVYALGILGWYGVGRFFLEPLRETQEFILGRVRVHQVVAGLLAIGAGGGLALILASQ
jgi:prolipoprotein diacylglyceryltransferase